MKMYHQKVLDIQFDISYEYKTIPNFDDKTSLVIQKIGEFIYKTDNIYLATNIRKLWEYFNNSSWTLQEYISILKNLNSQKLLDIKMLQDELYSSVIVSPKLMFIYYQNYINNFNKLMELLHLEIKEKENKDSFVIAKNIKVKLVVVNNILDYMKNLSILELMRYSGTPLPGGKSFIILTLNKEKLSDFFKINV